MAVQMQKGVRRMKIGFSNILNFCCFFFILLAFSIMNMVKSKVRNSLDMETTEVLMRLKYLEVTPKTIDASVITDKWLQSHTRCEYPNAWQQSFNKALMIKTTVPVEANGAQPPLFHDHTYYDPQSPSLLEKPGDSDCFVVILTTTGEALTAVSGTVKLVSLNLKDDQIWFWSGWYLVNKSTGLVLEGNEEEGSPMLLTEAEGKVNQKWSKRSAKNYYDNYLVSHYLSRYLGKIDYQS